MDEAQSLVDTLQKNTPGHIFKHKVSYLIQGLVKGAQELEWDVAIPDPPLVIPRDKPRLTLESFTALPQVYTVQAAFRENLSQSPPETYTARVGQLLLSAILFGGLVYKRWFPSWVEALKCANCMESGLWLDMTLTSVHLERQRRATKKAESNEKSRATKPNHTNNREKWVIHKRWFADPLSHALILRWHDKFPTDLNAKHNPSPLLAVRHYLDLILGKDNKTSESFVMALLEGSATRTGLAVPAFLLAYAEGKNKSVSLSSATWERLVTGACITTSKKARTGNNDEFIPVAEFMAVPAPKRIAPMINQEKMLNDVLQIILPSGTNCKRQKSESREALQTYFEKNSETMCPSLTCLILWCIDLLTSYSHKELIRGRVKGSIKASSVQTYLDAIGKRLITVVSKAQLLDLENDELHDIYREVIDICPTDKSKNTAGGRLYGFHQFLMSKFGVPSIDFSDLGVKSGPVEAGVNANLISFNSFDQMKKALCPTYSNASRMRKMQFFIATIAFRCGLRRNEVLKLRLIDFQGEAEPELLVRNNRYAYVKSSESIRRLPLWHLVDADELRYLLAWRKKRSLEDVTKIPESLLFCQKGKPNEFLPDHEVFTPIMSALHQVTGDVNLVFHHFRHSFATWMLIRLLKNFSDETRQRFHFLKDDHFSPANCDRLRKAVLENHMLGQKALYATAQLCGHAGPQVTLLHYIHLCDWLLGVELALNENQPNLDYDIISKVTGLTYNVIYYNKNKNMDESWYMSHFLDKLKVTDAFKFQSIMQKVDTCLIPEKMNDHPDSELTLWQRVIAIIRERQVARLSFKILAERGGFSEDDVKFWCDNAELLATMKTELDHPRHVHGKTKRSNPNFRFPHLPREGESRKIANIILNDYEASSGSVKEDLIKGVRSFIANFSVSETGIPCLTYGEATEWIRFLIFLKVPLSQIHVVSSQPGISQIEHTVVQKKLAVIFGLPESSVSIRSFHVHSKTGNSIIQVRNSHADKNGKLNGNYGFRFAMYLIAIIEGLE